MSRSSLAIALSLFLAACGPTTTHKTEVAAPQRYRPPNGTDQWLIEGQIDTETHQDNDVAGSIIKRTLRVTVNGQVVVEGALPPDAAGLPAGTLDSQYQGARLHVDCSSQRKTPDWIELRCRVLVNDEPAATLVM